MHAPTHRVGRALSDETRSTPVPRAPDDDAPWADPAPGTWADPGRTASPARRRWPLVAVVVMLVAALAGAAYLGVLARAWSDRADALGATADDLGARLARAEADLEQRTGELGTATAELATAQARIIELADEKARTGDDREVQRQLVAYQERVSEAAAAVATSLRSCVSGQDTLIDYLRQPELYDPDDLARFEGEVAALCGQAAAANDDLQRELDR